MILTLMNKGNFSVLMTTYHGETPEFLDASLNSILVDQTCVPDQLVLAVDGPIPDTLDEVIKRYKSKFQEELDVVYLPVNQGQSKASAEGFKYIRHEIFARMDSDDLCVSTRFERELEILNKGEVEVVGGWIAEFDNDCEKADSLRIVPERHEDIEKMFRKRMPLNNVTVMMKKSAVEKAGGYGRATVNEDYSLYVRMWVNGARFYNIPEVLCKVRIGNDMVGRRQDFRIYKDWKKDQRYLRENGKHTRFSEFVSNSRCFLFIITPKWVKKILYKLVLRKKVNKKFKNEE